jgi:phage baseplate assembly protein W
MSDASILERQLGWSLELEPLSPIDGAAGGLDLNFGQVSGTDALIQSLTLALVTLLGADLFNTRFGFDGIAAIAEESDRVLRRERIRMAVLAVLKAEPRVSRIITVRFADETGEASQIPSSVPLPRTAAIEALFETIGGEQRAISIGGEVVDVR